jgi:hypothetical protein
MATFQRINGLIDISSRNRSVFQVSVAVRKAADLRIPLLIGNAVFACLFNEIFKIGLAHGRSLPLFDQISVNKLRRAVGKKNQSPYNWL